MTLIKYVYYSSLASLIKINRPLAIVSSDRNLHENATGSRSKVLCENFSFPRNSNPYVKARNEIKFTISYTSAATSTQHRSILKVSGRKVSQVGKHFKKLIGSYINCVFNDCTSIPFCKHQCSIDKAYLADFTQSIQCNWPEFMFIAGASHLRELKCRIKTVVLENRAPKIYLILSKLNIKSFN